MSRKVAHIDLGLIRYLDALEIQRSLRKKRQGGEIGNTVIFCEHNPVYTFGKQDCSEDWLSSNATIVADGIEIVGCDRGGRITYHGPGQLVVYFIFSWNDFAQTVGQFVGLIEEAAINLLQEFEIGSKTIKEYPGVWVESQKIAAIGLGISRGVTIHGMALNVNPEMRHYRHIVPCGIRGHGITSIKQLKNCPIDMADVKKRMARSIEKAFRCFLCQKEISSIEGIGLKPQTEKVRLPNSSSSSSVNAGTSSV